MEKKGLTRPQESGGDDGVLAAAQFGDKKGGLVDMRSFVNAPLHPQAFEVSDDWQSDFDSYAFTRSGRASVIMQLGLSPGLAKQTMSRTVDVYTKQTSINAETAFLACVLGPGLFELSRAMSLAGLVYGTLILLMQAGVHHFLCMRLIEVPSLLRRNFETYGDIAKACLPREFWHLTVGLLVFYWFSMCSLHVNTTLTAIDASPWFHGHEIGHKWKALSALVFMPLVFRTSAKDIVSASRISLYTMLAIGGTEIAMASLRCLLNVNRAGVTMGLDHLWNFRGTMDAIGSMAMSFGGLSILPYVLADMLSPKEAKCMIARAGRRKLTFFFLFAIVCCLGWGEQIQHKTPLTHLWVLAGVVSKKTYHDLGSLRCTSVKHLVCTPLAEQCMNMCDKQDDCVAITYFSGWGDCQQCIGGPSLERTRVGKTFQRIGTCWDWNITDHSTDQCPMELVSSFETERMVYYGAATLITVLWLFRTVATFPLYFWPLCREIESYLSLDERPELQIHVPWAIRSALRKRAAMRILLLFCAFVPSFFPDAYVPFQIFVASVPTLIVQFWLPAFFAFVAGLFHYSQLKQGEEADESDCSSSSAGTDSVEDRPGRCSRVLQKACGSGKRAVQSFCDCSARLAGWTGTERSQPVGRRGAIAKPAVRATMPASRTTSHPTHTAACGIRHGASMTYVGGSLEVHMALVIAVAGICMAVTCATTYWFAAESVLRWTDCTQHQL